MFQDLGMWNLSRKLKITETEPINSLVGETPRRFPKELLGSRLRETLTEIASPTLLFTPELGLRWSTKMPKLRVPPKNFSFEFFAEENFSSPTVPIVTQYYSWKLFVADDVSEEK